MHEPDGGLCNQVNLGYLSDDRVETGKGEGSRPREEGEEGSLGGAAGRTAYLFL